MGPQISQLQGQPLGSKDRQVHLKRWRCYTEIHVVARFIHFLPQLVDFANILRRRSQIRGEDILSYTATKNDGREAREKGV